MKKYFTKYITVKNSIRMGDMVRCPDGSINRVIAFDSDIQSLFTWINGAKCFIDGDDYQLVKLFLCTKENIEIDDKVIDELGSIGIVSKPFYTRKELGMSKDEVFVPEFGYISKNNLIKVIGEISMFAKWVKEGDEFNENEVEIISNWEHKRNKHLEIGDIVTIKPKEGEEKFCDDEGTICEFQSKDENIWDWDDPVLIINVKEFVKLKHTKSITEPVYQIGKDRIVKRSDIEYKPTIYTEVKVQCSQCETFH